MQHNTSQDQTRPARPCLARRIIRWYKARVVRHHIAELTEQLETLSQSIAIDAVLAARSKTLHIKAPELNFRHQADQLQALQLQHQIHDLTCALEDLERQA